MDYWITRLDSVRTVLLVLLLGCIYVAGSALMQFLKSKSKLDDANYNRVFGYAVIAVAVLILLLVFVPSSSDVFQLIKP